MKWKLKILNEDRSMERWLFDSSKLRLILKMKLRLSDYETKMSKKCKSYDNPC